MKRNLLALLLVISYPACSMGSEEVPTPVERNTREAKPVATPYSSLDGSEDALPFKVREALLNSNEIEILVAEESYKEERVEKFMVQGFPIWGNRNITVKDEATRGLLVDGLFRDLGPTNINVQAACFKPHYTIKAKYKKEDFVIAICYQCRNFKGKTSKKKYGDELPFKRLEGETHFSGSVADRHQSKALPIFESIVRQGE